MRKVFASGGLLKSVVVVDDDGMVSRAPTSDATVTRRFAFVLLERTAAIVVMYTYSIYNHH